MAEATIAKWHKQPGEAVKRDELLVDIETDKVVLEVLAEADGVLASIVKGEGETVLSNELIATLDAGATASAAPAAAAAPAAGAPAQAAAPAAAAGDEDSIAAPAARKLAEENGINLASVKAPVKTAVSPRKTWLLQLKRRNPRLLLHRLPSLPPRLLLLCSLPAIASRSVCR